MKPEKVKKQPLKTKGKEQLKPVSETIVPDTKDNAAKAAISTSYSPLKLVLIEKSIEKGEEVHAKMLSDGCLVSYPTILDMVHGVKKRYGKRTLKAVADWLQVPVEKITP